jgi:hypothetical protein
MIYSEQSCVVGGASEMSKLHVLAIATAATAVTAAADPSTAVARNLSLPPPTVLAAVCTAQGLCTCYNTLHPPACYAPSMYRCEGTNRLLAGREPSGSCAIRPDAVSPSPSPTPSPSPSSSPTPLPSPSPSPGLQISSICEAPAGELPNSSSSSRSWVHAC